MLPLNFKTIGEGKPLLILHGLFGSLDNWLTHAKTLAHNRKVFIIDQRNHGRSPHTDEINYDLLAHDLNDFIRNHQLENVDILGHSMGGKTAMQYAAFYPNQFDKMIIADISPRFYPVHHEVIIEGLRSLNLKELSTRQEAEEKLANYVHLDGTRQFLLKNLYRNDEGSYSWRFNLEGIAKNIALIGEGTNFTMPIENEVLFIRGLLSDYIKNEDLALIFELFPNAQLASIENAGHWLHVDKPAEFIQIIQEFLNR